MRLAAGFPPEEDPDHEEPDQREPDRRRQTRPGRTVRFGLDPAPFARAEDAEDERAQTERGEHGADDIEMGAGLGRRVGDPPRQYKDREHEHHFPGEDPPPGEICRAEASDQRPDRDRDRSGGRNEAVGGGPALSGEVSRNEGDDRRQDQRCSDPFQEGPAEQ